MERYIAYGDTGLTVSRIALGGFPFGCANLASDWDPYSAEGRRRAISTIHAALDAGITYIDTAPGYGQGHSEGIIGEATQGRRDEFTLATKVSYRKETAETVRQSVETSRERLRTDTIDIVQFHGGDYTAEQVDRILNGGLLDALEDLREEGKIRFIGLTTEGPWTAPPLIESGRFDVAQLNYNLIYQAAARHVLNQCRDEGIGVCTMRTMTSGILQRIAGYLAPEWHQARDIYEVALKFILADSRVHAAIVGMRSPQEVERNMELLDGFEPEFDMADIPRWTAQIYRTEDEMHGLTDEEGASYPIAGQEPKGK
jgi:aryl-alcohol dehydrogenase-like predicted oxidoreductase